MARPPLVLETWGKIRRTTVNGKPTAIAYYRDSDGVTRPMQRQGKTKAEAERNLIEALRNRLTPSEGITGDTRVAALADAWWQEFLAKDRAIATQRRYSQVLEKNIVQGLGGLMIREATVSRLDRFVKSVNEHTGYATAKLCAVVLSGMFDMAARHDAIRSNPMRSIAAVQKPEREIRAHSLEDVAELRRILRDWDAGKDGRGMARVAELSDVVDMYLATGCRTGEVLALRWPDVDFDQVPPTVDITGTVAFNEAGKLWIQPHPKSDTSKRGLKLPPFAVDMLMRRRLSSQNELVFPSSTGTLRAPSNFLLQWHAALKGTRFEGEVPKTFRSTVATILKEMRNADAAKDQLGHSSLSVTEGHYIKPSHEAPDVTGILELFNVLAPKPRVNSGLAESEDQQIA